MKIEEVLLTQFPGIGKACCQSRREIAAACYSSGPVIISGEQGTGRDHVALIIHRLTVGNGSLFHRIKADGTLPVESADEAGDGKATYYLDDLDTDTALSGTSLRRAA